MGAGGKPVAAVSALDLHVALKAHGSAPVLRNVALAIAPGERVALLGPSGVGKSTLLSIAAGLDPAFEGRRIVGAGRLAMVFQAPRLLPWRTLAQNIALVPDTGGIEGARAALAQVGLGPQADAYPEKVSLGQQRRAALARALAVRPALMLLDEPLVSLDPENAAAMRRLVGRVLDETGAAALLATHDRREALTLADRIVRLGPSPRGAGIVDDAPSPLDRAARTDPAAVERAHASLFTDGALAVAARQG